MSRILSFARSLLRWLPHCAQRTASYRAVLVVSFALLCIIVRAGFSNTRGRALTSYSRSQAQEQFTQYPPRTNISEPVPQGFANPALLRVVNSVLKERCVDCHNPEKHKADLRLDSIEAMLRGGQDGVVVIPRSASQSPLIQCMLSTPDADGHMPPEEQPQPTADEIAVLSCWIDMGAPTTPNPANMEAAPEIRRLIDAVSERLAGGR